MVLDICEPRMRDAWNPTDPQWSPWEGRTHRASGCLFLPNHGQGGLRCLCWGARGKGRAAGLQALYQEYGQQQLETSFSSRVWNEANGLRCPSMLLHDSCLSLYLSFSCTDTRCIFFFLPIFRSGQQAYPAELTLKMYKGQSLCHCCSPLSLRAYLSYKKENSKKKLKAKKKKY